MPLILGTNSIKDTGFDVSNSVRLDSASTDALTRTFSGAGNRRTLTMSMWMKRSKNIPSGTDRVFSWKNNGGSYGFQFDNDQLRIYFDGSGGTNSTILTNRVFRDPSAWTHLLFKVDTTQSTEADRMRLYVNGVEETSFSQRIYPALNEEGGMNLANICVIGRNAVATNSYYDGYLCELAFIDGTAVAHTEFGEFDEDSNIWKPKDISGLTFGTNGFYLQFKESGTSQNSSGIGADTSGNDNHFAVENLTSIDQSTDTCTNNFATMNPLDTFNSPAISDGNTVCPGGSSGDKSVRSTIAISQGKWYWEVNCDISNALYIGIINTEVALAVGYDLSVASTNSVIYNANGGGLTKNGSAVATYTNASNAIIGFALDLDAGTLKLSKDGVFFNSGNAVATGIASDTYSPVFCPNAGGSPATAKVNFGNPAYSISSGNSDGNGYGNFEYSVPSGYYALNTKNLAEYG